MNEYFEDDPIATKVFMLSGEWPPGEKQTRHRQIVSLGGFFIDQANWHIDCTHVIASCFIMSEKVMGALAAGKWVLTKRYLQKSVARNAWQRPRPYISDDLVLFHRKLWFETHSGCFAGVKAVFMMEDEQVKNMVYARIVLAGGGQVTEPNLTTSSILDPDLIQVIQPPYNLEVTHVIVDPSILEVDHPRYDLFRAWRNWAVTQNWSNGLCYVYYKFLTAKIKTPEVVREADWSIHLEAVRILAERVRTRQRELGIITNVESIGGVLTLLDNDVESEDDRIQEVGRGVSLMLARDREIAERGGVRMRAQLFFFEQVIRTRTGQRALDVTTDPERQRALDVITNAERVLTVSDNDVESEDDEIQEVGREGMFMFATEE